MTMGYLGATVFATAVRTVAKIGWDVRYGRWFGRVGWMTNLIEQNPRFN